MIILSLKNHLICQNLIKKNNLKIIDVIYDFFELKKGVNLNV